MGAMLLLLLLVLILQAATIIIIIPPRIIMNILGTPVASAIMFLLRLGMMLTMTSHQTTIMMGSPPRILWATMILGFMSAMSGGLPITPLHHLLVSRIREELLRLGILHPLLSPLRFPGVVVVGLYQTRHCRDDDRADSPPRQLLARIPLPVYV